MAPIWKVDETETDRVAQPDDTNELGDGRLPHRVVDGGRDTEDEGEEIDVPDLRAAGQDEGRGQHRHCRHRGLGDLQEAQLGEPICEEPAVQPEEQGGQKLTGRGDAHGDRAACHRQHQPVLGDPLGPDSCARQEQTAEEMRKLRTSKDSAPAPGPESPTTSKRP